MGGGGARRRKPRCYSQKGDDGCRTHRSRCQLLGDRVGRPVAGESGNGDFRSSVSTLVGSNPACATDCWLVLMMMMVMVMAMTVSMHLGYGRKIELTE